MNKTRTMLLIVAITLSLTFSVIALSDPQPPNTPSAPSGPSQIKEGESACFTTSATNPEGNNLFYMFSWGDGTTSDWVGEYTPGNSCTLCHTYNEKGDYSVRAKAKDAVTGLESGWSPPSSLTVPKSTSSSSEATCFLSDTKVLVVDSQTLEIILKSIKDILIGDLVISYNPDTGELVIGEVVDTYHHSEEEMKEGYLIFNDNLKITPNHPVFQDNSYVKASELDIGDNILGNIINSIQHISDQQKSYNIEVEPYHNFLIANTEPGIISTNNLPLIKKTATGMVELELDAEPTILSGCGIFGDKNNLVQLTGTTATTTQIDTGTTQQNTNDDSNNQDEGSDESNSNPLPPEDGGDESNPEPAYLASCIPDPGQTITVEEGETVSFSGWAFGGSGEYEFIFNVGEATITQTDYEDNGYEQYTHTYSQEGTYTTSITLKDDETGQTTDTSTTATITVAANNNQNNPI